METTVHVTTPPKPAATPTAGPHKARGAIFLLLKITFSVLTIGFLLYTVDLASAWRQMGRQNLWAVFAAALLILMQILVGGLRWHLILISLGAKTPVFRSLQLFYASIFFNTWFIGALGGDVARTWLAYRSRVPAATAVQSVVLDRVVALAGTSLLVILTAPLFIAKVGLTLPAIVPAGLALLGLMGILMAAQCDRVPASWARLRLFRLLQTLGSATRTIFLQRAAAIPILSAAILAQTVMALSAYAIAVSLGLDVTAIDCIVLMQPIVLLSALPISIGGWGVRETAMVGLFALVGVPANAALVLSIQFGLLSTLVSLPGGLLWLALRGSDERQTANSVEARPASAPG